MVEIPGRDSQLPHRSGCILCWNTMHLDRQDIPDNSSYRRWTLRVDNHGHHHGIVDLSESPLYLELRWRASANDSVRPVGLFRLELNELLLGGYIRLEPAGSVGSTVRLRVVRDHDGRFYIQTKNDAPRFPLPQVS